MASLVDNTLPVTKGFNFKTLVKKKKDVSGSYSHPHYVEFQCVLICHGLSMYLRRPGYFYWSCHYWPVTLDIWGKTCRSAVTLKKKKRKENTAVGPFRRSPSYLVSNSKDCISVRRLSNVRNSMNLKQGVAESKPAYSAKLPWINKALK